jgi:hypothetical protein
MIPNIIHFVYGLSQDFGGKPFTLPYYLAVKSAFEVNKPDKIYFHYVHCPEGEWWERTRPYVTLVKIAPVESIFGIELKHYAHQADVARLMILIEEGGIYLDIDTICVKPFHPLRKHSCVIGRQGYRQEMEGLCNAVMMAEKNALFLREWLHQYKTFRYEPGSFWDEHSVLLPYLLSRSKYLKSYIHIESYKSFHYPLYHPAEIKRMFAETHSFKGAYCHHLWESRSYDLYLKPLTVDNILQTETTYNNIARRFLDAKSLQ